ncbi:NlpC/P60 family protein [Streptomyces echinatus]|uniref:NlpC/P60 family protein n=1 Tax=Streptomyces echinatus TaxID=67293 RepID=UPI003788806B
MPRFSAEQIYAFARQAGFSPDQATTMTAVALAESGGDSRAYNPVGEDSRGLWQINARAHPDLAERFDLNDPVDNARAAFQISRHGSDFSPWTTTHHGSSARYLRFQEEAQAAAVAHGDGAGLGVWSGTSGYGDPRSAGSDDGQQAMPPAPATTQPSVTPAVDHGTTTGAGADTAPGQPRSSERLGAEYGIPLEGGTPRAGGEYGLPAATPGDPASGPAAPAQPQAPPAEPPAAAPDSGTVPAAAHADGSQVDRFVQAALAQNGDQYVYGAETRSSDPNPSAFDCSELVEWAAQQAGLHITDGALAQYRQLHQAGTEMSVEDAIHTRGALLFNFSSDPVTGAPSGQHVAISLGDGRTIEAANSRDGVGIFEASTRRFNYAAMIPGTQGGAAPAANPPEHATAVATQEEHPAAKPAPPVQTAEPAHSAAPAEPTGSAPAAPSDAQPDGQAFSAGPAATEHAATEPPATEPDDFDRRLAADPFDLDQDTLPASLEFTGPTTPPDLPAHTAVDPYPTAPPDASFTGHPEADGSDGSDGAHGTDDMGGFDAPHATVVHVDLGVDHHGADPDLGHDIAYGGH